MSRITKESNTLAVSWNCAISYLSKALAGSWILSLIKMEISFCSVKEMLYVNICPTWSWGWGGGGSERVLVVRNLGVEHLLLLHQAHSTGPVDVNEVQSNICWKNNSNCNYCEIYSKCQLQLVKGYFSHFQSIQFNPTDIS